MRPEVNPDEARRFLTLLDPGAASFTFQTFDDNPDRKDGMLAHVITTNDLADPGLMQLYERGAGVYVTVSETDGRGRKSENITRFRAVWQEDDNGYDGEFPLEPSIVVATSPGKLHRYWLVADDWPANEQGRADHAAVIERMVADYGSDNGAKGPNRVLRVPGFLHRKATPHMVRITTATGRRYSRAEIVAAFPPIERQKVHHDVRATSLGDERERIHDALRSIPADDRSMWLDIGMALKAELGEDGRILWDQWSATSEKYDRDDQDKVWKSFNGHGTNIGTLFHHARAAGWRPQDEQIYDDLLEQVAAAAKQAEPADAAQPDTSDLGLAALNEKYAVVLVGSKARVVRMEASPVVPGCRVPTFMSFEDFRAFHQKWRTQVTDANGNTKSIGIGHWWLDHPKRRQYEGIVYAPGGAPNNYLNLWTGYGCEPREGDCSLYLEHLRDHICSGNRLYYEYSLNWMARAVQHPGQPGEVALVMRGPEGIGKGVFAREFGRLFGAHFHHIGQAQHLSGRFNAHVQHCSLLFGDEAFFAADRSHEGILKYLITEPVLMIEPKGLDAYQVANCLHIILASNNEWVVPAGASARRFFVLDVANTRMRDFSYFERLADQMDNGGREALLHLLLDRDLTNFNVREVPLTEALAEQKAYSRRGVDRLIEVIAHDGCLPAQHIVYLDVAVTSGEEKGEGFYPAALRSHSKNSGGA
jgi:Primase C terminal 2 (PriCT-2)/Family of unknown function (DUF5906)/RepB DNA-primase from phage plasmid